MIRSWEQICNHKFVNIQSCSDHLINAWIKFFCKSFCVQMPKDNSAENGCDGMIIKLKKNGYHIELVHFYPYIEIYILKLIDMVYEKRTYQINIDCVKVSNKSTRHCLTAAIWWSHSTNDLHFNQLHGEELFIIIPSFMVQ